MSRLYGRTIDIYSISKYLNENHINKYTKDKRTIDFDELNSAIDTVKPYLSIDTINYLMECDIQVSGKLFAKETIFSGYGEENNIIIFPSRTMKEEYKRELMYFIGELLKRKNPDLIPSKFDIKCQYSDMLPLLVEYLYMKETGNEDKYSDKHLNDLALNAKEYVKIYEGYKNGSLNMSEDNFLMNSLLYLVPLSSLDATLQVIDLFKDDKDKMVELLSLLIENANNNREEIMTDKNISTYGFKRLRKEIDYKRGK